MPGTSPIHLVEVGPRDGLQNEKAIIPTPVKVAFVDALSQSGVQEIEVTSFVSPKWIPQLADAAEVLRAITRSPGVSYTALVPNLQGMERALAAGIDGASVFTAASETFTRKNINATIAESIERFRPIMTASTLPIRGYVSTAFHCPYEGPIRPDQVLPVVERLLELGCQQISIGDTIGKAVPEEVRALLEVLLAKVPADRLALHLHDTYGNAVLNAEAGAAMGITVFDGSAGGIGGCPYAPGAKGNIATQALVGLFGARTAVSLDQLNAASMIVQPYLTGAAA